MQCCVVHEKCQIISPSYWDGPVVLCITQARTKIFSKPLAFWTWCRCFQWKIKNKAATRQSTTLHGRHQCYGKVLYHGTHHRSIIVECSKVEEAKWSFWQEHEHKKTSSQHTGGRGISGQRRDTFSPFSQISSRGPEHLIHLSHDSGTTGRSGDELSRSNMGQAFLTSLAILAATWSKVDRICYILVMIKVVVSFEFP